MSEKHNYYLGTLDRMEPDIAMIDASAGWASIAISLRRIADGIDRLATGAGLTKLITEMRPMLEALDK